jgi:hypothetical protein
MAREFKETAHNKTNKEEFDKNFDEIDWGDLKDKPVEKNSKKNVKHVTAGLCGEYGMSVFDDKKYKENFDQIDWSKNGDDVSNFETGEMIDGKDLGPEVLGEDIYRLITAERVGVGEYVVSKVDLNNKSITVKAVK